MSQWPDGIRLRPIHEWPGPMTKTRKRSPFEASWSDTLALLRRELRMIGATTPVLQMALREQDFRLDGLPRATARPDHPGVILSMQTGYGPLMYPCDAFEHWQDNVRAIALALEALRKVDRYGVTKRGEQYTGWRQIETKSSQMAEEEARAVILGALGWTSAPHDAHWASLARRAKRNTHPDMGGSQEAFHRVAMAAKALGLA